MAAFLANVGVNAAHAARSPLFDDGTFELIPIPERTEWGPPMLRFGDLRLPPGYTPAAWQTRAAHVDPDLRGAISTYGDNCRWAGRAFSLRRARKDDVIVFIARLHPPSKRPSFNLVGCLVIVDVLADVHADPGPGWWDQNAHVRRARAKDEWNSFWVFKGGEGSRAFERAVPFAREEARSVFGDSWCWRNSRTELQTIGSYTRAIRRIEGEGESWLRTTCRS